MREMKATEYRTIDEVTLNIHSAIEHTRRKLKRLNRIADFGESAYILDVGSGQGRFVAACHILGHRAIGIEPSDQALSVAKQLSEYLSVPINIIQGTCEDIPFDDETFDIVHANSVIEHVKDLDKCLSEIFRVLKPGRVFWFSSASSMCPLQNEIAGYPLFGWYPNPLKLKIMHWTKINKPELIGFTETPAINWFTPWKARHILMKHGFRKVFDRYELRGDDESAIDIKYLKWLVNNEATYNRVTRLVRNNFFIKLIADILLPGCSYAATK